jgi:hypothetical protein
MDRCFSSSKETITKCQDTMDDETREVNSNNPPVVASSGPDAGIFATAAQNFMIVNSQFIDVGGNYVVCDFVLR